MARRWLESILNMMSGDLVMEGVSLVDKLANAEQVQCRFLGRLVARPGLSTDLYHYALDIYPSSPRGIRRIWQHEREIPREERTPEDGSAATIVRGRVSVSYGDLPRIEQAFYRVIDGQSVAAPDAPAGAAYAFRDWFLLNSPELRPLGWSS
jgi:hypothetical protein